MKTPGSGSCTASLAADSLGESLCDFIRDARVFVSEFGLDYLVQVLDCLSSVVGTHVRELVNEDVVAQYGRCEHHGILHSVADLLKIVFPALLESAANVGDFVELFQPLTD